MMILLYTRILCIMLRFSLRLKFKGLLLKVTHYLYFFLFYFSQIYNLLYNGAISKYVVRKHLCGAIIQ
jgi:hypothetical protein